MLWTELDFHADTCHHWIHAAASQKSVDTEGQKGNLLRLLSSQRLVRLSYDWLETLNVDGPNCISYVANEYWVLGDECKMKTIKVEMVLVIAVIVLLNVIGSILAQFHIPA